MNPDKYLSSRVDDQIAWYDRKAIISQKMYVRLQTLIIMLSLFLPILLSIPKNIGGVDISTTINSGATIISIFLAVLIAYQSFHNYREKWAAYRTSAETLKHEKYMYLTISGKYRDSAHAFENFVETIEGHVFKEHAQWAQLRKTATAAKGEQDYVRDEPAQPDASADAKEPRR